MTVRLPLVDGVRGLAAVAVVIYHVGQLTSSTTLSPFGFLAVDLFFMLSGFVISTTYEYRLLEGLSVARFMLVRVVRLYPALLLGVILAALLQTRLGGIGDALKHLLLIPRLSGPELFPLNPVLWSLLFELALNFVHALVAARLNPLRVAVFAGVSGAAFAAAIWAYHGAGLGWNGATLVPGCARACWGYGIGMVIARTRLTVPPVLAWVALTLAILSLFAPAVGPSALRVGLMLFVLFPLATKAAIGLGAGVADAVLEWLGGISYPLYAVHYPLVILVAGTSPGPRTWALATAAIVAFAALVELFYDEPLRRAAKRAIGSRRSRAAAA